MRSAAWLQVVRTKQVAAGKGRWRLVRRHRAGRQAEIHPCRCVIRALHLSGKRTSPCVYDRAASRNMFCTHDNLRMADEMGN